MKNATYHHGNLRNELIEAGVSIIANEGEQQLSLRKVAAHCGVSHNAPYMHFKDKQSFLAAICEHIDMRFTGYLRDIYDTYSGDPRVCMGKAGIGYVTFMVQNPDYFRFMYNGNLKKERAQTERFSESQAVFSKIAEHYLATTLSSDGEKRLTMLAMWAIVQGLASLFVSGCVPLMPNYEKVVETILSEKMKV